MDNAPTPPNDTKPTLTVKNVDQAIRFKIADAAARDGLTMGEWMNKNMPRLFLLVGKDNRLPATIDGPSVITLPPAPPPPPTVVSVNDLTDAFSLAERMAAAQDKPIPRSITRAIESQLKHNLGVKSRVAKPTQVTI